MKSRIWIAPILLLSACSGYKVGYKHPLAFKTLRVEPVINAGALIPQTQGLLTRQIIETIQARGQVRLVRGSEAEAILTVKLTDYKTSSAALDADSSELAIAFKLHLVASITLRGAADGVVYLKDHKVSITHNIKAKDQNFVEARKQLLPTITEKLAKKIATEILSTW